MKKYVDVSIIYVYYNTPRELIKSVGSIKQAAGGLRYEVIIVDNASPKPLPVSLNEQKNLKIIKNGQNYGFGKAINQAAKYTYGDMLLVINPDTIFHKHSIKRLYDRISDDRSIGAVGPKLVNNHGRQLDSIAMMPFLPRALLVFSFLGSIWPFRHYRDTYYLRQLSRQHEQVVDVLGGACIMVRKTVFEAIRGFDERFFMYFEEADFSYRIRQRGLSNLYYPRAVVTHLIGRSLRDKMRIKKIFEQSRFRFFQKYHGALSALSAEVFLRLQKKELLIVFLIVSLSAFLNLYRIDQWMMFFGDFGRDFLAARDMVLMGRIPLVGITSSVTWLHQGPLSIYFIALSFFLSNFNPVSPAILYGIFGTITTFLVYLLGRKMFSQRVGYFAAAFFATSPLVLVNLRIPYHTASIPMFSAVFLFLLWRIINKKKSYFLFGLFFGLLFLLELSNAVLLFVVAAIFFIKKVKLSRHERLKITSGFLIGISPFILYDISHRFSQTFGFGFWVMNRIRLFFGLTFSHASTSAGVPGALVTIWDQLRRLTYPQEVFIVVIVFCIVLVTLFLNMTLSGRSKQEGLFICTVWVFISLLGFTVHAAPGTAYFPLVFVPFSLLIGYSFHFFSKIWKPFLLFFFILIASNGFFTVKNQYFLDTRVLYGSQAPGWNYGMGAAFSEQKTIAQFLVNDAKGQTFVLKGGGFLHMYQSSIDNYKYLVWWLGGKLEEHSRISYTLYLTRAQLPAGRQPYFVNRFIAITKCE